MAAVWKFLGHMASSPPVVDLRGNMNHSPSEFYFHIHYCESFQLSRHISPRENTKKVVLFFLYSSCILFYAFVISVGANFPPPWADPRALGFFEKSQQNNNNNYYYYLPGANEPFQCPTVPKKISWFLRSGLTFILMKAKLKAVSICQNRAARSESSQKGMRKSDGLVIWWSFEFLQNSGYHFRNVRVWKFCRIMPWKWSIPWADWQV